MTSDDSDLGEFDAAALVAGYRQGRFSPVEATRAALARIERFNPAVNAYCHVDHDGALAAARDAEARWRQGEPLSAIDGVPCSLKDLSLVRGMPAREGSLTTPRAPRDWDSPPAAFLRDAGAVILGKTTTPEFGWKAVTDSRVHGVTRNPWDTTLTPGGSSGGAAVAAALNMGVLHQGGDSGGSIRIPCAFTGVFGFKSTFGWVPQWPASTLATLSHIGPITRTVDDAIAMLDVIGRFHGRDFFAQRGQPEEWGEACDDSGRLDGLNVAYAPIIGGANVDGEVAQVLGQTAARFEALGARIERVEPELNGALEVFRILWAASATAQVKAMTPQQCELLDPGFLEIARFGERFSAADLLQAQNARNHYSSHLSQFFRSYDLLLTPSVPITAFAAGHDVPPGSGMRDWMEWTPFSYPFNLTQHPAASMPCGFTSQGLPVGAQLVGARYDDPRVLSACRTYLAAHPPRFPERLDVSRCIPRPPDAVQR